jgi:dihydroneopterin aldolase
MMKEFDTVGLTAMQLECIVGIHPHERATPQPLRIELEMHFDRKPNAFGKTLADSVDYSVVAGEVAFALEAGRFRLLETAAEALCHLLLAPAPPDRPARRPKAVSIRIQKPLALNGVAEPWIAITRHTDEVEYEKEINHFGEVDILHENEDCGIYLLRIPAGAKIPAHYHALMEEGELVISDGLLLQNEPAKSGVAHQWPKGFVHEYENSSDTERSILCVNAPKFIPSDERLVEGDELQQLVLQNPSSFSKRFYGLETE